MDGTELTFTKEALIAVAEKAIKRKTGARGLRAILEESLLELMYDMPDRDDVAEVIISADVISKGAAPELVLEKKKKKPAADAKEA